MSLGRWIRRRRKALSLTQQQLAQRAGCATDTIRKIEASVRPPSQALAEQIATALELSEQQRAIFVAVARSTLPLAQLETFVAANAVPPPNPALLPRGTVTFFFTDIAGSTRLWELDAPAMQVALARHNRLLESVIHQHGGSIFKLMGDSVCAAFASASDALVAAVTAQRMLLAEPWTTPEPVMVRMALHTGVVEASNDDYVGPTLNRVARLLAAAHGRQILISRVTEDLVRDQLPAGVSLRDLGMFRLRDILAPERIFQVLSADLPQDLPAPMALPARLTNLPLQISRMVDRSEELDELLGIVRAGKRLITLTGPGGVGKTRLTLRLVEALMGFYLDGIWFVDLSAVYDSAELLNQVAQVLGIVESDKAHLEERLLAWLREKRMLMVLDNAEQLHDSARLIERWLQHAPDLVLVVSSRFPLRLAGEQEYLLHPLVLPERRAATRVDQAANNPAVLLFVERAQELQPSFRLTPGNVVDLVELCWLLDGLPLAIELAAARTRMFTPRQLLAQLQDRGMLRMLSTDLRTMPVRHQTIQSTLEWSFNLLGVDEQVLFTRLGVFVGSWTLEAAEAICADATARNGLIGAVPVIQLLERLVEHNLVQHVQHDGARPRFNLLRSMREYAQLQLDQRGEAAALHHRHAEWYMALVQQARTRYEQGDNDAFVVVHEDLDNLRLALDWAIEHDLVEQAAQAAVELGPFWSSRMPVKLTWLEAILARADHLSPALHARLLALTGSLSWEVFRNPAHARDLCQQSLAIYRGLADQPGIAMVLTALGQIAVSTGDMDRSQTERYLEESLAIRIARGNQGEIAETLIVQARLAILFGELRQAHAIMGRVLVLRRLEGSRLGMAVALYYLSALAFLHGEYERMETLNRERLAIERAMGNPQGIADCNVWLGVAALWRGDHSRALALVETSLNQLRELGEERNLPHILDACAHAAVTAGRLDAARVYQLERLDLLDRLGVKRGKVWSYIHLGFIALAEKQPEQALEQFRLAYAIIEDTRALTPYRPTYLFADLSPRRDNAAHVLLLEGLAMLAVSQQPEQAADRLAAAATLRNDQQLIYYFPDERANSEATRTAIEQLLAGSPFSQAAGAQASPKAILDAALGFV